MNIITRQAKSEDAQQILDMLTDVALLHKQGRPDIFNDSSSKYSVEQYLKIINDESTPVLVAQADGEVAGYAFCMIKTPVSSVLRKEKYLYIDDFCVSKSFRHRHIGGQLMDYVKEYAASLGIGRIELNVWAFNEAAIKFYESCGMTPQRIEMEIKIK